jgi:hypothetical protein
VQKQNIPTPSGEDKEKTWNKWYFRRRE